MALFGRSVALSFGTAGSEGREFTDLRVKFRVEHKGGSDPNKAVIEVWGLSKESAALLQDPDLYVRLSAGHETPRQIFEGEPVLNGVSIRRMGPDRLCRVEALDGGRTYQDARTDKTIATGSTFREILEEVMESFGLPIGKVEVPENSVRYPAGLNLSGPSRATMDSLAASVGAVWGIADGVINFTPVGEPIKLTGPLFSVDSGNLIGSPVLKDGGSVELVTILDPDMRVGTAFRVESEYVSGDYTATSVAFSGDSHGYENQFYCQITGDRRESAEATPIAEPGPGSRTFSSYFGFGDLT